MQPFDGEFIAVGYCQPQTAACVVTPLYLGPESLHAALNKMASPDDNLVGVADVIDRGDLAARKLLAVLMGQHLQFELHTVSAAFGAQPVDAMQPIMAHPGADLLLGERPPPRQQLCAAVPRQEALDDLKLELCAVLPHETP